VFGGSEAVERRVEIPENFPNPFDFQAGDATALSFPLGIPANGCPFVFEL